MCGSMKPEVLPVAVGRNDEPLDPLVRRLCASRCQFVEYPGAIPDGNGNIVPVELRRYSRGGA